jgi:ABC-type molybdate transport system substrate-binding protein
MMIGALWMRFSVAILCWLYLICGGLPANAGELLVSSAVSLKEAVEAAGRRFQGDRTGVLLRYNIGASGELRQQIEGGAPVEVFLSAGQSEMDALERKVFLVAGSRRILARNSLVVIVPVGSTISLSRPPDLLRREVGRLERCPRVLGVPRSRSGSPPFPLDSRVRCARYSPRLGDVAGQHS